MKKTIILVLIGFSFLSLLIYLALSMNHEDGHTMDHGDHVAMINSERDFLEHMIPHHEEAVETSKVVKEKGGTLRPIRELVDSIESDQTKEIEQMKAWYLDWYGTPYEDKGMYVPMMRDLSIYSGTELDRVFLEDMIAHHEMAVVTAKRVLEIQTSREVSELATRIINAQEREIVLMKDILKLLPLPQ